MIDVNSKKDREKLMKAVNGKDGKLIMEYLWQLWKSKYHFSEIDRSGLDSEVGQKFKESMAIYEFLKDIENISTPKGD